MGLELMEISETPIGNEPVIITKKRRPVLWSAHWEHWDELKRCGRSECTPDFFCNQVQPTGPYKTDLRSFQN